MGLAMSHIPKRWVLLYPHSPVRKLRHRGMNQHAQVSQVPWEGLEPRSRGTMTSAWSHAEPVFSQARNVNAPQGGLPVIPPSSFYIAVWHHPRTGLSPRDLGLKRILLPLRH